MKVYTIQTVAFYEELMRNGLAYCTRESHWCQDCRVQYDWMADQMRKKRSIQGTIWYMRKEWVKVAHIFNGHSEIKRIIY